MFDARYNAIVVLQDPDGDRNFGLANFRSVIPIAKSGFSFERLQDLESFQVIEGHAAWCFDRYDNGEGLGPLYYVVYAKNGRYVLKAHLKGDAPRRSAAYFKGK
ncbi:MAG: hypothetical protein V3W41_05250 [Planctomycetota bacterium]